MDVWVPLVAAAIGALAGVGGAYVVTRGQDRAERRNRLEQAFSDFLTAAHDIELFLQRAASKGRQPAIPAELNRALTLAMARVALLAPFDTHQAVDDYGKHFRSEEIRAEIRADDAAPTGDLWETAVLHMRRDLENPPRRMLSRRPWFKRLLRRG